MTVIVTDTDYRMTLPIVRDLVKAGHTVVATYRARCVGGMSKGVFARYKCDDPLDICKKYDDPVLLCVGRDTIEYVSENIDAFRACCKTLVPSKTALDQANDKAIVLKTAASIGIPIPKAPTKYPCIAKFPCGEKLGLKAAERYFIVKDKQMHDALSRQYPDLIFQEKITGDGCGVCLIMKDGKAQDCICHRRIREFPVSGGPSSCCETFYDENLANMSEKLLRTLGFDGIAMVEWKGGKLMEINPRVWGSYALTRASGSPFTLNWAALSAGAEPIEGKAKPGARMKFFPSEAKILLYSVKHAKFSLFFQTLCGIFTRDGIWEWRDLKGTFAYIKSLRSEKQ